MQTKLTLRLDDALIHRAKAYAARTGKSVSEIVADYFGRLEAPPPERENQATVTSPAVRSLIGAIALSGLDEQDYREHVEGRHR